MDTEHQHILDTAMQYYQAFKTVDPSLIEKHFSSGCRKTGFMYDYDQEAYLPLSTHALGEISAWVTDYNTSGHMPDTGVRMEVLDKQDHIAAVKLVAAWAEDRWGVDYILLVKYNDQWAVADIVWQSLINPPNE